MEDDKDILLYHYTSAHGLHGIFTQQTVWATESRFLNDLEEIHYASSIVMSVFTRALKNHPERNLILSILHDELSVKFYPFVFSLSEHGDLLSQWRSYCPPSGGFAIGFRKSEIQRVCDTHGYKLVRCYYDKTTQEELLRPYCEKALRRIADNEHEGDVDSIVSILNALCEDITEVEPSLKHPSFQEEQEWRVVSYLAESSIRVSEEALISYAKLDFSIPESKREVPLSNLKCIGEWLSGVIVVGPSRNQKLNRLAVSELLGKVRSWEIVLSDTTYRIL